jgi:hypothetical protein
MYELTCNVCHMSYSYIGQTTRSVKLRYQEHIRYIKSNEPQSTHALHIRNNKYEYGPIHITTTH